MTRCVAFLRGINLGKRRLPMTELKRHFEAMGFADVATFVASGNVVFATGARDLAKLETRIEAHLVKVLGYSVDTFLRRDGEVAAVIAATSVVTYRQRAYQKLGISSRGSLFALCGR